VGAMSIESNYTITYQDPYRIHIPGVSGYCHTFIPTYKQPSNNQYYKTLRRGSNKTITYPVTCADELDHLKYQSGQAAIKNEKNRTTKIGKLSQFDKHKQIDEITIELADLAFYAENKPLTSFKEDPKHIYSLLIYELRCMSSFGDLTKYLLENPDLATKIGYEDPTCKRNYYRISNNLKEKGKRKIISNAAKRIVHGIFRNGYPIPDKILAGWNLNVESPINVSNMHSATIRAAIYNWMDYLFPEIAKNISFNRTNNKSFSIIQIVGSLAQAALIEGCYSARPTAGWHYNDDELIRAEQLSNLMSSVDIEKTRNMFRQVNENFINTISDFGFFESGYNYAADATWIDYYGDNMKETINNPHDCNTNEGLCFAAVSIMSPHSRFAVGIDIVYDKKNIVDKFSNFLYQLSGDNSINGIYMDRGFFSDTGVQTCRIFTSKWVIRAKVPPKGEIREKYNEISKGESFGPEKIGFSGVKPRPKLYIHPIEEENYPANTSESHMLFLVGESFDKCDGQEIYDSYRRRWSIETYFRQLKNNFSPKTRTKNINERFFLINIGQLFYNIHTLINRVPSPRYGVLLNVPHYMVLKGIVEYVFSRDNAFTL
jgi:hypothetical protein